MPEVASSLQVSVVRSKAQSAFEYEELLARPPKTSMRSFAVSATTACRASAPGPPAGVSCSQLPQSKWKAHISATISLGGTPQRSEAAVLPP